MTIKPQLKALLSLSVLSLAVTGNAARQGLDNYYSANSAMIQHPVIETLWFQMVVPGMNKGQ